MEWIKTGEAKPREGVVVETKIHDHCGCRNERSLKLACGLWWLPDDTMYVYYQPTHWRYADAHHD